MVSNNPFLLTFLFNFTIYLYILINIFMLDDVVFFLNAC